MARLSKEARERAPSWSISTSSCATFWLQYKDDKSFVATFQLDWGQHPIVPDLVYHVLPPLEKTAGYSCCICATGSFLQMEI